MWMQPSPHVDWSAGAVSLLTEARPWPVEEGRPRRAGVSSFGISGTNAHVILEQAPSEWAALSRCVMVRGRWVLLVWVMVGRWVWWCRGWFRGSRRRRWLLRRAGCWLICEREELDPLDVGVSLARRSVFEHRAVVVGAVIGAGLMAGLADLAAGRPGAGVVVGQAQSAGKTVMVFPGQGSQWVGMGRELMDSSPVFAEQMRCCGEALGEFVEWSLIDVVRGVVGCAGAGSGGCGAAGVVGGDGVVGSDVAVGGGGSRCGDRSFPG